MRERDRERGREREIEGEREARREGWTQGETESSTGKCSLQALKVKYSNHQTLTKLTTAFTAGAN